MRNRFAAYAGHIFPAILLMSPACILAQHISAGLMIGLNASQVDGDYYAGYNKVGINAGATAFIPLSEIFSLSMEISYSQRGSIHRRNPENLYDQSYRLSLDYVDVPLMLNLRDKGKFLFGAGVGAGTLVRFREVVNEIENIFTEIPYKKTDLNWVANVFYELTEHLNLNARFSYSLVPVRKFVNNNGEIQRQYHNVITVRAAYLF